jgi:hypothetical protein
VYIYLYNASQDSVFSIATGYGLDNRGWSLNPGRDQEFSLLHVVETNSGAEPASYPMGTGALSWGVGWGKQQGRDHSPSTAAKVKKM